MGMGGGRASRWSIALARHIVEYILTLKFNRRGPVLPENAETDAEGRVRMGLFFLLCGLCDLRGFFLCSFEINEPAIDVDAIAEQVQDKFMSAFIRAVKPAQVR